MEREYTEKMSYKSDDKKQVVRLNIRNLRLLVHKLSSYTTELAKWSEWLGLVVF